MPLSPWISTGVRPSARRLASLSRSRMAGETATTPASSGTGYLSVVSILQRLGEQKGWEYLDALHKNIAEYTKSGSKPCKDAAAGERAIGVSFEYVAHEMKKKGAHVEMVLPKEGSSYEMEANALTKKGAKNPAARQFLVQGERLPWGALEDAVAVDVERQGNALGLHHLLQHLLQMQAAVGGAGDLMQRLELARALSDLLFQAVVEDVQVAVELPAFDEGEHLPAHHGDDEGKAHADHVERDQRVRGTMVEPDHHQRGAEGRDHGCDDPERRPGRPRCFSPGSACDSASGCS